MFQRDFIDRQGPQRRGKNLEGLAPLRAVLRIAPLGFFGSNQLERAFAERLAAILCPPGSPASLNRIGARRNELPGRCGLLTRLSKANNRIRTQSRLCDLALPREPENPL